MAQARNYKVEYRRRLANAAKRGLTRSQARGHPGKGEPHASRVGKKSKRAKSDPVLDSAIAAMRGGESLGAAAKRLRVSRERLSAYAKDQAGAVRTGARWTFDDRRGRSVPIIAQGHFNAITITVPGYDAASLAGLYWSQASEAAQNQALWAPFIARWSGVTITDVNGREYKFSIEPNDIYRTLHADEVDWSRIYQIYSN
ncbi:MAG: hypothetical protein J7498_11195 [Sphingobium sp.]|nr:hypothetical protein [Sphingobium sp.]